MDTRHIIALIFVASSIIVILVCIVDMLRSKYKNKYKLKPKDDDDDVPPIIIV